MIKKLYLSEEANDVIEKLIASTNSKLKGSIAAIDPDSGEVYYGKSIAQAAKTGRDIKKMPKAIFFYVKVGYPSVYDLNKIKIKEDKKQNSFPRKRKMENKVKECKPCVGLSTIYCNKTIIKNKSVTMVNFLI